MHGPHTSIPFCPYSPLPNYYLSRLFSPTPADRCYGSLRQSILDFTWQDILSADGYDGNRISRDDQRRIRQLGGGGLFQPRPRRSGTANT